MKRSTSFGILLALFVLSFSDSANAERAWNGSIHVEDANLLIDFDGYDYGEWDDVGRLTFPGRPASYSSAKFVGFRIMADEDNLLRATLRGKVRIKVDGKSAELEDLILVRTSRYAHWKIDPKIIEQLKNPPVKAPQQPTESDCSAFPSPPMHCSSFRCKQSSLRATSAQLNIECHGSRRNRWCPQQHSNAAVPVSLSHD